MLPSSNGAWVLNEAPYSFRAPERTLCQVEGFPSSFLSMRRAQWLLAPLLDATRPMDAMAMSFDLPAEDEIATAGLAGVQACIAIAKSP